MQQKKVGEIYLLHFNSRDTDEFVATVSDDTLWVYNGTQLISKKGLKKLTSISLF